jgi:rRNA maturation endonuclease Nob1
MQAIFAVLCERCDVAFHLPGDRFCASCRAAVDREFAGVPG